MAELLIEIKQASRAYRLAGGPLTVLSPLSCRVWAGDRIAVVGPSGSGKSTLLNLMAGLDRPSSGEVTWPSFGGARNPRPARIACVFQMPSLIAQLTARENVELPARLVETPGNTAEIAGSALELLGLGELADRLPEELSGGQNQAVEIARALVTRPRLLLADEPTSQLDQKMATKLLDAIFKVCADSNSAIVLATHDPAVASRMDRIWHLDRGVLSVDAGTGWLE
jgi:ABC-type lipoprotein export system ATPase subunit